MTRRVYLDHNASTPVHPEVVAEMTPYFDEMFGNPSSVHGFGRDAREGIDSARDRIARFVKVPADQIVFISEYTGGGFGSKIPSSIFVAIPALLSKKANAPVMMRITREEEHFIGRARPGILARVKAGFRKDGRRRSEGDPAGHHRDQRDARQQRSGNRPADRGDRTDRA